MAVLPLASALSACSASACGMVSDHSSASQVRLPASTACPSATPETPSPGWLEKSEMSCAPCAPCAPAPAARRVRAPAAIAFAIGCSEASSTAPASRSSSPVPVPCATTSVSVIRPVVTVPVLSSTTVSTRRVFSSTSGPLIRMPSCAPRPVPTRIAVGVARPIAHGQAMISTATAAVNAWAAGRPAASQPASVATAIASTAGTKTAETRSARRRRAGSAGHPANDEIRGARRHHS